MRHIYSQRFVSGRGENLRGSYTVPPACRAVVRAASAICWTADDQDFVLRVAGVPVWYQAFPTRNTTKSVEGRWVAYAGESIEIIHTGTDCSAHVAGFLFED